MKTLYVNGVVAAEMRDVAFRRRRSAETALLYENKRDFFIMLALLRQQVYCGYVDFLYARA